MYIEKLLSDKIKKINILSVFIFDRTNLDSCLLKSTYPETRFYKREREVGERPSRRRKGSRGMGWGGKQETVGEEA